MMSHGETTWADGLIPMIGPKDVTGIISRISDVALLLTEAGVITGIFVNPEFAGRQSVAKWEGAPIQNSLTTESMVKFELRLKQFLESSGSTKPVELNHIATDGRGEMPMRYSFHSILGDGTILMLGDKRKSQIAVEFPNPVACKF